MANIITNSDGLQFLEVDDVRFPLDKHGYLLDITLWQPAFAEAMATIEAISLTAGHWEVIEFVQAFYQEFQTSPAIRLLVKAMAERLGPDKGNSKYLFLLFPDGPAKQATKLAGLPKPAKCL